ncbi:MAG: hypothetical protein PWP71_2614 [Clostridia bacterium]|nr:hypothetical protein [Clostridia bacterium]
MSKRKWNSFESIKTDRIHPNIPEVYNEKIAYMASQTGISKERLITSAIYTYLSYVAKKVQQGEDLLTVVMEINLKTQKNIEELSKKGGKHD